MRSTTLHIGAVFADLNELKPEVLGVSSELMTPVQSPDTDFAFRFRPSEMSRPSASVPKRSQVRSRDPQVPAMRANDSRGRTRELLRATYLKLPRDAVSELGAKKGLLPSQILHSFPSFAAKRSTTGTRMTHHASPARSPV